MWDYKSVAIEESRGKKAHVQFFTKQFKLALINFTETN